MASHASTRTSTETPGSNARCASLSSGSAKSCLPAQTHATPAHADTFLFNWTEAPGSLGTSHTYTFNGMKVDDYPVAMPGEIDAGIKRTLTFTAERPAAHLYFRAAVGDKIAEQADGSFVVGDKARYKFTGAKALIRNSGGKSELLISIPFDGNSATLVEEIAW